MTYFITLKTIGLLVGLLLVAGHGLWLARPEIDAALADAVSALA